MPAARKKPKQTSAVTTRAKRETRSKRTKTAVLKTPKKRRVPKRKQPAKQPVAPMVSSPRAPYRPHKHVGFLSLILILLGALTCNGVVLASTQDMQRLDQETQTVMVQMMQPKEYLYQHAAQLKLDADLLNHIAYCESKWRMVKNASSSAYGYFQIVDGTERLTPQYAAGLRKYDAFANIDMALYIFKHDGATPWFKSMPCWKWYDN